MVPHFIVVKNQMNEYEAPDNDPNRCVTRDKGDATMLKALGMQAQEIVIFGHHHPLPLCGICKLVFI